MLIGLAAGDDPQRLARGRHGRRLTLLERQEHQRQVRQHAEQRLHLLVAERRYPNRVGQTYRLRYSPAHRWFYFPQMERNEALVFKVYDSEKDGRARFTAHTSFNDPQTPAGAPPRQSIEARALAFFLVTSASLP